MLRRKTILQDANSKKKKDEKRSDFDDELEFGGTVAVLQKQSELINWQRTRLS
jgi:hypothetical protein